MQATPAPLWTRKSTRSLTRTPACATPAWRCWACWPWYCYAPCRRAGARCRDPQTGNIIGQTPFMASLLFIIMLCFLIAGIAYGGRSARP